MKNERELTTDEIKKTLNQVLVEEFKDSFNEILNLTQESFFDIFQRRTEVIINDSYPLIDISTNENTTLFINAMKEIHEDYYIPIKFICNKALTDYKARSIPRQKAVCLTQFNPHCFNNKIPNHTCKGKFFLVKDSNGNNPFVVCEKCLSCYYVECIKMNCDACDCDFLSCEVKDNDSVYPPVTWSKYHCGVAYNKQMTCMKCRDPLWLKGKMIICKNCNKEQKAEDIEWICLICHNIFHSDAKIYNPLEFKEMKLAVKNALVNKLIIKPTNLPCKCDDNPLKLTYFHKHNCNGTLFSGEISQKKIVVCSLCKVFCSLNKYKWTCPICMQPFKTINTRIFKMEDKDCKRSLKSFNKSLIVKAKSVEKKHQNANLARLKQSKLEQLNNCIMLDNGESRPSPKSKRSEVKFTLPDSITTSEFKLIPFQRTEPNEDDDSPRKANKNKMTNIDDSDNDNDDKEDEKNNDEEITDICKVNKSNKNKKEETAPAKKHSRLNVKPSQKLEACDDEKPLYSPQNKKNKGMKDLPLKSFTNACINSMNRDTDEESIAEFCVEDYNIFSQLGQGTYGKIYLVEDKQNNLFSMKKIIISDKDHFLSLAREYDIYAKYKHKNILSILGISKKKLDDTTYSIYILMEVGLTDWEKEIEGRKLRNNFYAEKDLMNILRQLVSALVFLQRNNVSHRDIKAQNILIFKGKTYKLADFGEARQLDQTDPKMLTLRGTELYMAPLLFNGLKTLTFDVKHNPYKSDVYSLGLCMVFGGTLNIRSLIKFRDFTDNIKIKAYLNNLLCDKYSKNFIELLVKMVSVHEDLRPDFIELEEILKDMDEKV